MSGLKEFVLSLPKEVKIVLFEYILTYTLQSFIIVLGLFAFCKKEINAKKYIIASFSVLFISIVIRNLPIKFGVHTLLILISTVLIGIWYLKYPVDQTIKAALFITFILLSSESINIFALTQFFGSEKFTSIMTNNQTKFIAGLPSNFLFSSAMLFFYYRLVKRKHKKLKEE